MGPLLPIIDLGNLGMYVALLHAAGGRACTTVLNEIGWYRSTVGTWLATRCKGLGLRCCARRDSVVLCFATRCRQQGAGPAPLCPTRSLGTLICYTLHGAGPARRRPTGSHGVLLWGWACTAVHDVIAWYTACYTLHGPVGLGLCCCVRRDRMVRCFAICCSGLTGLHDTLLAARGWARGPVLLCPRG